MRLFLIPLCLFAGCIACGFNSNLPNCHADDVQVSDDGQTITIPQASEVFNVDEAKFQVQNRTNHIAELQRQIDLEQAQIDKFQLGVDKAQSVKAQFTVKAEPVSMTSEKVNP